MTAAKTYKALETHTASPQPPMSLLHLLHHICAFGRLQRVKEEDAKGHQASMEGQGRTQKAVHQSIMHNVTQLRTIEAAGTKRRTAYMLGIKAAAVRLQRSISAISTASAWVLGAFSALKMDCRPAKQQNYTV